jgi:integrase
VDTKKIEWNIDHVSILAGEQYYLRDDFIEEPSLLINKNLRFSDHKWNIADKLHPKAHPLDFTSIRSKLFRVFLKKITLRNLYIKRNRNSTVYNKFKEIKKFILYLENEKYMYDLRYLTPEVIREYAETIKKSKLTKNYLARLLKGVENFLQEVQYSGYDLDLSEFQEILVVPLSERKAESEARKIPNIPKKIFNHLNKCALNDMKDETLRKQDRMIACLIVILSHTGMRKGELHRLEAGKLNDITILNKKAKAYVLEFFTYKTTAYKNGIWTKTIAFPETVQAYRTLEELSKEKRIKGDTNFLFLNRFNKIYGRTSFDNLFDAFFFRNQKKIFEGISDDEKGQVQRMKIDNYLLQAIGRNIHNAPKIGETMYALNPHQFRVAVANILKDKVSLQWIRRHMNHLDEEMTKHYFRDDNVIKQTLFKRAANDGKTLELKPENNNLIKNELSEPELQRAYEEISKFLKKRKFNIFKDIDEIIKTLKYNPLRENIVGVCTKHLGLLCERQYRLATLEKWYYLSPKVPNIESFDFTYRRFIDKAKIVQHNKGLYEQDLKYKRDYENEYSALQKFYQNRVLPEHKLLGNTLNKDGKEDIYSSFPQLKDIIFSIDNVNKEIAKWVSTLSLKSM